MEPYQILEGKDKLIAYFKEKGFEIEQDYKDPVFPNGTYFKIDKRKLLVIYEVIDIEEVKKLRNHYLLERGLSYCAIIYDRKIIFFRNFGEGRYFLYSERSKYNIAKLDKLKKISDNFDILFYRKDISGTFYEEFNLKRNFIVRNIKNNVEPVEKYLVAQKIFDRIFFIYFLCHKGIIKFENDRPISGENLFHIMVGSGDFLDNLKKLFHKFNTVNDSQFISFNDYTIEIPYLNGGLFRPEPLEQDLVVDLDNSDWENIFNFLNQYHWMIEEDVESAIEDEEKILTPEILGHVYERSVVEWEQVGFEKEAEQVVKKISERKRKGVYYTPEEITSYIARNTIYPLILKKTNNKKFEDLDILLENSDAKELENTLKFITNIKICDPACGSGAFLIKASEILFYLKVRILKQIGKSIKYYDVKLDIITNNIYGVDILEGAIEITKLRLWLWLVSDYIEGSEIQPLPNIEYNLKVGDSLLGWVNEDIKQVSLIRPLTDEVNGIFLGLIAYSKNYERNIFQQARELLSTYKLENYIEAYNLLYNIYRKTHGLKAENLKGIIEKIRKAIYDSINPSYLNYINEKLDPNYKKKKPIKLPINMKEYKSLTPFHWKIDFGHIFENGGFDVIIGNPPYIRVESLDHTVADIYKSLYESVYQRCDIYVTFIQISFERINKSGMVGLITANQYMVAEYGIKIREFLTERYGIHKIIDFTHYPVFPGISIYTAILIGSKNQQETIKCMVFESKEAVDHISINGLYDTTTHQDINKFEIYKNNLTKKNWVLISEIESKILEKIYSKCNERLGNISLIGSPLTTGRDSVLYYKLLKEDDKHYYIKYEGKELKFKKEIWKKILRPRILDKWFYKKPETIVFFPYEIHSNKFRLIKEKVFKENFQQTYNFILNFKNILLNRKDSRKTWKEHGRKWYSLHRIGMPDNYFGIKILTQSIINESTFCIDTNDYLYPHGGIIGIVPNENVDPYSLIAYLNSKLAYFEIKTRAPAKRGGYISLNVGLISDMPIPMYKTILQPLNSLSKKIVNRDFSENTLEKKINEILYRYFEINEEEQIIIESM